MRLFKQKETTAMGEKSTFVFCFADAPDKAVALIDETKGHITSYWTEHLALYGDDFIHFLEWMQSEHGFEISHSITIVNVPEGSVT